MNRVAESIMLQDMPEGTWKTRDRTIILISDLRNDHLRNCISMLKEAKLDEYPKFEELVQEARSRGWTVDADEFLLEGGL